MFGGTIQMGLEVTGFVAWKGVGDCVFGLVVGVIEKRKRERYKRERARQRKVRERERKTERDIQERARVREKG